jgi:hypothetical protein
MSLNVEVVVDGGVSREKSLRGTLRLEPLLLALASPNDQMRVLRSIVVGHAARSVSIATVKLPECGSVGSEFVRCETLGMNAISLQQLAQQSQSGAGMATPLNEHVQNLALVVDRMPQPHALTADLHGHLIQVPATGRLGSESPQVPCEGAAEFQGLAADRLVARLDAALRQQLLDIPQAEGEPEVEPDS